MLKYREIVKRKREKENKIEYRLKKRQGECVYFWKKKPCYFLTF